MTVWDALVGQRPVITALSDAASGRGMSQAFLFTGPPGSGRSNAAVAFAAALQCEQAGCGTCQSCHTVLAGSHADVSLIRTEKLSIGVDEVRDLVRRSALAPVGRRWQVLIVEDADRLTEQACNALLKAIEEPTDRTVWVLCAPTVEDVLPTIRSRCRLVTLSTPSSADVADFLVRVEAVAPELAAHAARASQGHIGRAKALAKEEAEAITSALDAREKADLDSAFGVVERGRRPREYAPALSALEKGQKTRAKRRILDVVDRGLMDLVSVYRDAIVLATVPAGSGTELVNAEMHQDLERLVRVTTPESNLARITAVFTAREQMLEFNVPAQLALESMMVGLRLPEGQRP